MRVIRERELKRSHSVLAAIRSSQERAGWRDQEGKSSSGKAQGNHDVIPLLLLSRRDATGTERHSALPSL